jgi:predicted GNAT family acetyltransferase
MDMDIKIESSDGKFYAKTEHGQAELLYSIEGGVIRAYHTFTPKEDRGKGIAERLAMKVIELAKERNLKIRPECSYMKAFLRRHKELRDYEIAP